jgi:hypothetical protein
MKKSKFIHTNKPATRSKRRDSEENTVYHLVKTYENFVMNNIWNMKYRQWGVIHIYSLKIFFLQYPVTIFLIFTLMYTKKLWWSNFAKTFFEPVYRGPHSFLFLIKLEKFRLIERKRCSGHTVILMKSFSMKLSKFFNYLLLCYW